MAYNYLNMSLDELLKEYYENKNSIIYYQNKINQQENMQMILIGINFFFSWTFVIIGLYSALNNKLFLTILGLAFIGLHFYCYTNIHPNIEEKEIINNLENQNEFIATILENKYNYKNYQDNSLT